MDFFCRIFAGNRFRISREIIPLRRAVSRRDVTDEESGTNYLSLSVAATIHPDARRSVIRAMIGRTPTIDIGLIDAPTGRRNDQDRRREAQPDIGTMVPIRSEVRGIANLDPRSVSTHRVEVEAGSSGTMGTMNVAHVQHLASATKVCRG